MIGGIFIYNHKGEVLISRVYRDDIGLVEFGYCSTCLNYVHKLFDFEINFGTYILYFQAYFYIFT